jgi:hypothetical protein
MSYLNKTINDGPYASFKADPNGSTIPAYRRCKFVNPAGATIDGKPILQLCSATERADVITMEPIAAGAVGSCKFANSGGEQFGVTLLTVATAGVALYGGANGFLTTASGGGAVLVGTSTSPGVGATGTVTYAPAAAAA